MVKVLKTIGFSLFFIASIMFFLPKTNFYYLVENELKKQNIVISNETIIESGFKLDIKDADVFFNSIKSAKVKDIEITSLLFYNSVDITDVKLYALAGSFFPTKIQNITFRYTILNPLNININANGGFGKAKATFSIVDKRLHLTINPSKKMLKRYKKTLRFLTKNKDGAYSYDTNFN